MTPESRQSSSDQPDLMKDLGDELERRIAEARTKVSIVCHACNGRGSYGWDDCEKCGTTGRLFVSHSEDTDV